MDNLTKDLIFLKGYNKALDDFERYLKEIYTDDAHKLVIEQAKANIRHFEERKSYNE